MSVNPFTVSMTLNVWQRIGLFFDSRKCNRTLPFRGTSTPAEERPKILSSDPADSSYTLLHLLGSQVEMNLWSCGHFDAFGVFPAPREVFDPLVTSRSVPCLRVCEGVKNV